MLLAQHEGFAAFQVARDLGIRIVQIAEDARIAGAARAARRLDALAGVLHAERAFLHHALRTLRRVHQSSVLTVLGRISVGIRRTLRARQRLRMTPIELAHAVGACRHAIAATDAALEVHQHHAVLVGVGGAGRAYALTGRIVAMLTAHGKELHARLPLIVQHRRAVLGRTWHEHAVPPNALRLRMMTLADHRAGSASDASIQVDRHRIPHAITSLSAPPASSRRTSHTHSFHAMLGDHTLDT